MTRKRKKKFQKEAESSFGVETMIGIVMEKTSNLLGESLKPEG